MMLMDDDAGYEGNDKATEVIRKEKSEHILLLCATDEEKGKYGTCDNNVKGGQGNMEKRDKHTSVLICVSF